MVYNSVQFIKGIIRSWFDIKFITPGQIIESLIEEIERFYALFESIKKPQDCS